MVGTGWFRINPQEPEVQIQTQTMRGRLRDRGWGNPNEVPAEKNQPRELGFKQQPREQNGTPLRHLHRHSGRNDVTSGAEVKKLETTRKPSHHKLRSCVSFCLFFSGHVSLSHNKKREASLKRIALRNLTARPAAFRLAPLGSRSKRPLGVASWGSAPKRRRNSRTAWRCSGLRCAARRFLRGSVFFLRI